MIPVLMITHNRLEYTKQAVEALFNSHDVKIFIIDNNSTDGTVEWLKSQPWSATWRMVFNSENKGIAGAMNQFLKMTEGYEFVGKVDNDTIVPEDWVKMRSYLSQCDIIQAKHHIIPATHQDGWDGFTKNMKRKGLLLFHHFVGGSGILFRRSLVNNIPQTDWVLGGWREFQRQHPELRKAFCEEVEVKLLDDHGYSDFPDYYKQTKRLV